MNFRGRCLAVLCLLAFGVSVPCVAQKAWVQPTAEELAMKDEPKAPGAPAIVLSYDEVDEAESAEVILHVRIKVLTAGGLDAGTVELPDKIVSNDEIDRVVAARTIHADGSIVEFKPTPQNFKIVGEDTGRPRRVLSLPDVQVGSILEYMCHFAGQNTLLGYLIGWYAPDWQVQNRYFTRQAHFVLKLPGAMDADKIHWVANLPAGARPVPAKGRVELTVTNVSAAPLEDYMPPPSSFLYRVRFFYNKGQSDDYWARTGAEVDDQWFDYVATSKVIVAAARELAPPGDNDETRLRHLYDAVQQMDNTDLSRAHTAREDKHLAQNSTEIWTRRRGNSQELTLLFVALARAAGYKAYPMAVSSRQYAVFNREILSWSQMDDMVAIVDVKGKEVFFDPGTRRCTFAELAPWHSNVVGISTEAKQVKIRYTPKQPFTMHQTERTADLTIAADGSVTGTIKIAWVNNAALPLRRLAISQDRPAVDAALKEEVGNLLPPTLAVSVESMEHLDDAATTMLATLSVTGRLGLVSAKRLTLPAQLFAGQAKPILVPGTRSAPVAFPVAAMTRDTVVIHYPQGLSVEAAPTRHTLNISTEAVYDENVTVADNKVAAQRTFVLSRVDYAPEAYPALHKFFASVADADQEQILLTKQPAKAIP